MPEDFSQFGEPIDSAPDFSSAGVVLQDSPDFSSLGEPAGTPPPQTPRYDENRAILKSPPPEGVLGRLKRTIRESASSILGPTEDQVLRDSFIDPVSGEPLYKPLAGDIEKRGFLPAMSKSMVDIPELRNEPGDVPSETYGKAILNTGANIVEFALSPLGMATGGAATIIPKVVAGGFAADLASKVPEAARAAGELSVTGTEQQKHEANLGLGTQIAFAGLTGAHAAVPKPKVITNLEQSGAPLTARALEQSFEPAKTAPVTPPEGERMVAVQRPDGTTYQAAFGDKFWEFGEQKMPSIARLTPEGKWSHGLLGAGEKIVEDFNPSAEPAMGVVSPGSQILHKVIEELTPPKTDAPAPPVDLDVATPLPDFQPQKVSTEVFSRPFAMERMPVLGKLFGGRFKAKDPVNKAIATWYGERYGVGKAVASAVGEEISQGNRCCPTNCRNIKPASCLNKQLHPVGGTHPRSVTHANHLSSASRWHYELSCSLCISCHKKSIKPPSKSRQPLIRK